jgi:UDP-glucose 4-epimerase
MRVGITGVLGDIGSHLAERLIAEGVEYRGLDNRDLFSEHYGDITNFDEVRTVVRGCDGIVHLAGVASSEGTTLDPNVAHKINVLGTLNVIDATIELSTEKHPKWMIYISCYQVYGKQPRLPAMEWARCHPIDELGVSKLLAEDLVSSKCIKLSIPYVILRLSKVYGGKHPSTLKSLPGSLIQQSLKGEPVICPNEHDVYDLIYIEDVVTAILPVIRKLQASPISLPLMNICSGVGTRGIDLVTMIHKLTGTSGGIKKRSSSLGHAERFVGAREKAGSVLGWVPKVGLPEGLEKTTQALKQMHVLT